MSNPNQHIEEYLDKYIKLEKPKFAVLITGSWGCGKTHFIDHYIENLDNKQKERIRTSLNGDEDTAEIYSQKERFIRISLNGIEDTAEIYSQILVQCFSTSSSGRLHFAKKLLKGVSKFFNVDEVITSKDIFHFCANKLADNDLERCHLPIIQTLGFLNEFVENHGIRVVLLGYEKEIAPPFYGESSTTESEQYKEVEADEKQTQYRRIREKVIGKTFTIEEHSENVIPCIIKEQPESLRPTLESNKQLLISIVKNGVSNNRKEYNYRAFQHTLRDFQLLVEKLDQKYLKHSELMRDLLHTFCVIDYEIQLGRLTAKEIYQHKSYYEAASDKKDKKTKIDALLDRNSIKDNGFIFNVELWVTIFENKAVSKKEVNEALANSVYFYKEKTKEDYIKLCYWQIQEDDEVVKIVQTVREGIANYKYTVPGEILQIFANFLFLSQRNVIRKSQKDVLADAKAYIETLAQNNLFINNEEDQDIDDLATSGYGHFGYPLRETEEFQEIAELLISKVKEVTRSRKKRENTDILKKLVENPKIICKRLICGDLKDVDVFKDLDAGNFLKAFMEILNKDKEYVGIMLKERYCGYRLVPVLKNERDFLTDLDKLSQEKLSASKIFTPSLLQLKLMKEDLQRAIAQISSTLPEKSVAATPELNKIPQTNNQ